MDYKKQEQPFPSNIFINLEFDSLIEVKKIMRVILIVLIAWLFILSFIFRNETLDIQLYDTYYIIGVPYIMLVLAGLVLFSGLILRLMELKKQNGSSKKIVD